jgi:hypothetical protein
VRAGNEVIGWLFAVDCDADDLTLSAELEQITVAHLGETPLVRFGRLNRWVRLYRSPTPVRSNKTPRLLEVLGAGRQVLAFGIHPDTAEPYSWSPDGSPVTVKASDLPLVSPEVLLAFLREMGCKADAPHTGRKSTLRLSSEIIIPREGSGGLRWTTDAEGLVVDGRDAFLAWCVARTSGNPVAAFDLFAQHADLTRPKKDGRVPWTLRARPERGVEWPGLA